MKFNKIMLMGIFLLTILTISAVSASNNVSETDIVSATDTISEIDSAVEIDSVGAKDTSNIAEPVETTNTVGSTNDVKDSSNTKVKKTSTEENSKSSGNENVYKDITIDISDKIITPVLENSEINYICYVKDDKMEYFDGQITVTFYMAAYDTLTSKKITYPCSYTWNFDKSERITGFWILNNDKIVLRKTIVTEDEKKDLNIISSTSNTYLYNKLFYGEDKLNQLYNLDTVLYMVNNNQFNINPQPTLSEDKIVFANPYEHTTHMKVEYLNKGEKDSVSLTKSVKITQDIVPTSKYTPVPTKATVKLSLKKVKVKKSAKKLVLTATIKKGKKAVKNKKVTFKFNGKKYTRKTNSKGIAKLTIKKSTLKKLKVGKKIKYQISYGGKTSTKTAKVKK